MSKPRRKANTLDIAERIARDIQSGALAPGMWLKQIDLERRYRCTRLEVRRALDRLAQRRLVQHNLNRGYQVYEPDGRQTAEVLEIRCILETAAVDSIVAHADAAAIDRLRALARGFDDLILIGTLLELYETNLTFHGALLALCANRELATLATDLRGRTSSAPAGQWRTRARIDQSAREHHAMVDALASGDARRLKRILALHIRQPEAPVAIGQEEQRSAKETQGRSARVAREGESSERVDERYVRPANRRSSAL